MELSHMSRLIIFNISGKREIANRIIWLGVIMDLMHRNSQIFISQILGMCPNKGFCSTAEKHVTALMFISVSNILVQ